MIRRARLIITGALVSWLALGFSKNEQALSNYSSIEHETSPEISFTYATNQRWSYFRLGLAYLESPQPLALPEAVPPTYVHPDEKGFGAYGFSPGAYLDVQRLCPYFRKYSWEDILHSQKLYDLANQAYADWLLSKLQSYFPRQASPVEIFNVLQQAWNLGLSGFKQGRQVVASRAMRAQEFLSPKGSLQPL